jgi:glycosyltransferase involved in cell wall biosynthesis
MNPVITTIIPTYKRPFLLKRAIQSVLNQTFHDFELRIYDNASNDETESIVHEFMNSDHRVKYHCHKENIGSEENFRFGLERINSSFFTLLSDDDQLLPWFYQTAIDSFAKFTEAKFFTGRTIILERGKFYSVTGSHLIRDGYYTPLHRDYTVPNDIWTSMVFRKEVLQGIGTIDPESILIDVDFVFRLCMKYPFISTSKPCAVFTRHENSVSYNLKQANLLNGFIKISNKLRSEKGFSKKHKQKIEDEWSYVFAKTIFNDSFHLIYKGYFQESKENANFLRSYFSLKNKASYISFLANICKKSSFLFSIFRFLFSLRRTFLRQRNKILFFKKYNVYSQFILKTNKENYFNHLIKD